MARRRERGIISERLEEELEDLTYEELWDSCEVAKAGECRRIYKECFWLINLSL